MRVPRLSSEPVVSRWTEVDIPSLLAVLGLPRRKPVMVAIDGRSGAGKSTLAGQLVAAVPGAAKVATDDIAWHFSMFDWSQQLVSAVIEPVRRGEAVRYRPPGWVRRDRPGALTIEADRRLLVIEGVGSSQQGVSRELDAVIWVQSDAESARELGIARDVASGVNGDREAAIAFWDNWDAAEVAFLEQDAPWTRADVLVAGVPAVATTEGSVLLHSNVRSDSTAATTESDDDTVS